VRIPTSTKLSFKKKETYLLCGLISNHIDIENAKRFLAVRNFNLFELDLCLVVRCLKASNASLENIFGASHSTVTRSLLCSWRFVAVAHDENCFL
jgi:hypothetical protein